MSTPPEGFENPEPFLPAIIALLRAGAFLCIALVAYAALWSSAEVGVFWPVLIPVFALPAVLSMLTVHLARQLHPRDRLAKLMCIAAAVAILIPYALYLADR